MKPRDLFGVGVRLLGVWLLYHGATYIAGYADLKLFPASTKIQDSSTGFLIYATIHLMLAAYFLLWTESLANWTYGDNARSQVKDPDARSSPEVD